MPNGIVQDLVRRTGCQDLTGIDYMMRIGVWTECLSEHPRTSAGPLLRPVRRGGIRVVSAALGQVAPSIGKGIIRLETSAGERCRVVPTV